MPGRRSNSLRVPGTTPPFILDGERQMLECQRLLPPEPERSERVLEIHPGAIAHRAVQDG